MDTVDKHFVEAWLNNIGEALGDRTPDYLVVHHLEPDHSAGIVHFMETYPNAVMVASEKAFTFLGQLYGKTYDDRRVVVAEGSVLELGKHALTFVAAPMVHWPEVMVSYESCEKVLFSADGFGKFGALDVDEEWDCEARRYYIGIVGKYGQQVQTLLKKAAALDIKIICPLHGPVLTEDLGHYINLYDIWSSYRAESEGVTIAYASMYGNTKRAAETLAQKLETKGVKVSVHDLARTDMAEAVEDAFRYDRLVLASVTYNGDIFPFMKTFIDHLIVRSYKNRKIAFVENGTWTPMAAKVMKKMLESCKNITYTDTTVTIKSALNKASMEQLNQLTEELV